ncbi:hypothetical protein DKP74_07125 [Fructilactobacillus sanfranciscensis]|uniref:hypothetical protein n=1 Tax=Fructilactobacillus sanfranciscensis TaxID=1625 RepID=UPI00111A3982|nr:hypothetical protein [Fructilactobacillus sanfranciscensis]TNK94909.1 hypothetical protein DKP74_07125 [Fructilactobacillus sanfranciscensis]
MDELERLEQLEKKIKVRKRKALTKKYEKLGRNFYKKTGVKSMSTAEDMLTNMPLLTKEQFVNLQTQEKQLLNLQNQLKNIANGMEWTGNYWHTENLKEVTEWLSQFRKENDK